MSKTSTTIVILVPRTGSNAGQAIKPGSAVVTLSDRESNNGQIKVAFCDDADAPAERRTFSSKVRAAAAVLISKAPKAGSMTINASEVQAIGIYDPQTGSVFIDNQAAFDSWYASGSTGRSYREPLKGTRH